MRGGNAGFWLREDLLYSLQKHKPCRMLVASPEQAETREGLTERECRKDMTDRRISFSPEGLKYGCKVSVI